MSTRHDGSARSDNLSRLERAFGELSLLDTDGTILFYRHVQAYPAQPDRAQEDKFETAHRLNDEASLRDCFPSCAAHVRYPSFEPSYYFGSKVVRTALQGLHRVLQRKWRTALIVTIWKPA